MYPKFEFSDLGGGLYEVRVKGKEARSVHVESLGSGNYRFQVGAGMMQTCHGHPVLEDQNNKPGPDQVPPAAVISIIKGAKALDIVAWSTYWREGSVGRLFLAFLL